MSGFSPASVSEDGDSSRRAAQKTGVEPGKGCKVCGDKANGYNFGVLTCESCKAFFRRNAIKENEIKCPFTNNCGITPASRRYCQACRLNKCFAVGMSRDWLTEQKPKDKKRPKKEREDAEELSNSDDEVSVSKAYLKELIRKAKRRPVSCECTCTCGFYPKGTVLTALNSQTPSTSSSLLRPAPASVPPYIPLKGAVPSNWRESIDPALFGMSPQFSSFPGTPLALQSTALSAFSPLPQHVGPASCEMAVQSPSTPGSASGPSVSTSIFDGYSKLFDIRPVPPPNRLTDEDNFLLQELAKAAAPLNQPLDIQLSNSSPMSLMEVVKITEKALRRIVCMTRDISAFNGLPIDERKNLIKGSCCELLILRGAMAFDSHRNLWFHSVGPGVAAMEIKLDVFKGTSEAQAYEQHKKFLESIDDRVRKQEKIINVLMAIIIFQPERASPEHRDNVAATYAKYHSLLRRVLETEYGDSEAAFLHDRIRENLSDLRQLNQGLIRIYYGFDAAQLDPLIKELFDINSM